MKPIIHHFADNIVALTTTREDGFSCGPYATLNMAYHVGDDPSAVQKNRRLLADYLSIDASHIITAYQSHSDIVAKVDCSSLNMGALSFESGMPADALYTKEKMLAIGVFHADCVPIFIYEPRKKIIAIIHAGGKGSLKEITKKTIQYLKTHEHLNPKITKAILGPARCFAHTLATKEEAKQAIDLGYEKAVKITNDVTYIDYPLMNVLQLEREGLIFDHIYISPHCTYEENEQFFSYAKDRHCGRMLSVIMRKD